MRLSLIFLGVLATSVLVTALAAWGIVYGTSYGRVSTMSSEFTTLANAVLGEFSSFVEDLIQGNADLVNSILTQQRTTGTAMLQRTNTDTVAAIGTLVNYSTNATQQSQQQMNAMVDTFAGLVGSVVGDFRTVTTGYASKLRASLAENAGNVMNAQLNRHIASMLTYRTLQDLDVLNFSRTPWDPIDRADCVLLGAVCATMDELSDMDQFTLALATGRYYNCTSSGGSINLLTKNGSLYDEDRLTWLPYAASMPASAQKSMKQRCLAEAPGLTERIGQHCPQPPGCQCGNDQRCESWYQLHMNDTNSSLNLASVLVGPTGIPYNSFSLSLTDPNTTALLAVLHVNIPFAWIEGAMSGIGISNTTLLAIMFNDPVLSLVALLGQQCGENETRPGDPSLPFYSAVRTCDPDVRWISEVIYHNRTAALQNASGLVHNGVSWDVYQFNTGGVLMVVGAQLAEINGPIDASNARATRQLAIVRAQQLSQVTASGAATRAYVAAVGAQNIATTQGLEASLLAQLQTLENSSRTSLAASQQSSTSRVQQLTDQQTAQVAALKARNLSAMSTTAGWTIGVVFGILLLVLLASAWGIIQVTVSLIGIIDLMEAVADMRVENLEVPQHSSVREVARIQTAFQVLIRRLAEYKSYIPAGLFEQREREAEQREKGRAPSARDSISDDGSNNVFSPGAESDPGGRPPGRVRTSDVPLSKSSAGSARSQSRRNVAVLCVNVLGFLEVLSDANENHSKSVYNDYVAVVHEAVSQHRGNVDCILGDQVFVTFNAHLPCADSAGAAATAALEVRWKLLHKVGDKLKFQIGLSFGAAFAGSVGYVKYKSMVTAGSPMKVAALLAHLPGFQSGAVLVDAAAEERMKFVFTLAPVELVHMPSVKSFGQTRNAAKRQRVFALRGKAEMQVDEWMYQLQEGGGEQKCAETDWVDTFDQLVAAKTVPDGQLVLQQFLARHPTDDVALRLSGRLPLWVPGFGVPL